MKMVQLYRKIKFKKNYDFRTLIRSVGIAEMMLCHRHIRVNFLVHAVKYTQIVRTTVHSKVSGRSDMTV